ncbi:MAG: hypothetical protein H6598_08090 [Flavobacteriales bacterium]|nr:hypothetical protein [Flavobacteriales bacterium]
MKQFFKKYFSWSGLSLLIIAVALIWSMLNIKLWKINVNNIKNTHAIIWTAENQVGRAVINQDVTNYYCYLPAAFIHKDLTFRFVEENTSYYSNNCMYWLVPVKDKEHSYVIKMSMGMSFMYMPFFLMAHGYTIYFTEYRPNGFTPPYEIFLVISSIFYVLIGFYYLRKLLLKFFKDGVVAVVLLLTMFATNLYYYSSTEPAMSHAYSFSLIAIFAYLSVKWIESRSWKNALVLGLIGGLIVLIRPVNILVFLWPLLFDVKSFSDLTGRLQLIFNNWKNLLLVILGGFVIVFPQLLFWKINSGSWVYYSYNDEHFFFKNPQIFEGLFGFRKGWLLYTPIMIFAIFGIVVSYFKNRRFFWSLTIYLPLHIYIIYSWWCWWYGGSFGSRPMIETYALLAFPLAVWIDWIKEHWTGIVNFSIMAVLITSLNLFQTIQYRYGSIHYHGMTKRAYWLNFGTRDPLPGFYDIIDEPDYDKAKKGIYK